MTLVLEVIAAPPPWGVAEIVKLSGSAPQLVQPTVNVAEVSATVRAEMVAIGWDVLTVNVFAALVNPPESIVTLT
jgi:hypothetical protein